MEEVINTIKKEIENEEWNMKYHTNKLQVSQERKAALEEGLAQVLKDNPEITPEWADVAAQPLES